MIDVSVLIVNWNTRQMLANCLDSLGQGEVQQGLAIEIIVVDNASTDGSADMVRDRFPGVTLIENDKNVGFARANNQAIAVAVGRNVMLLNSDTVVMDGALGELVGFMDEHPQAGACGPRLLNGDGSLQPSCHPMLTPWREFWRLMFLDQLVPLATYRQDRWATDRARSVEVIKGACMLLRRKALDQVGDLDARYFMYTEEMDLCLRLKQAGWTLHYVPMAQVLHFGEASSRQEAAKMYLELYRSKVQFHAKFGGERRVCWFKALVKVAYWPRLVVAALAGETMREERAMFRSLLNSLPDMK